MRFHHTLVVLFMLAAGAEPALAQSTNDAYQLFSGGTTFGASRGYRQAILQQKQTGDIPGQVIRGPGGSLFSASRIGNGSAAFVSQPESTFLTRTSGTRLGGSLGGLGWRPEVVSRALYTSFSTVGPLEWLSMIGSHDMDTGLTAPGATRSGGAGGTPLNAWISLILG
jgi:hypothetical protein